jgi:ABC-2 type transport system ATP-binding protein
MLQVEGVSKRFRGGNYGVRELSLRARPGVLGLLGPNGAGKTTLMQMIATVTKPTAGRILFDGVDVARDPDAIRRRLGYLPQDFGVYDNLTALEMLDYVARLKGVRRRARVREMLELVNLHGVGDRRVGGFSGGMRQRLGIAQALVGDPDLVIVDEPTAGLDPEERVRFRNVLSEISGRRLVILSTHIVSDVESIAGEIAVVREGRLVASGPPEALLRAAEGSAWEAVVSSAELERRRAELTVSNVVQRADGVHLRLVATEQPLPEAVPVEPDLEDAYLFLMRSAGPPPAVGAVA